MSHFRLLTLAFTCAAVLATGRTADADPVQIRSGFLTVSGAQSFFSRGFLRSISYDLFTDAFRLTRNNPDGFIQDPLSPSLDTPSFVTFAGQPSGIPVAAFANWDFRTTPAASPTSFELEGTLTLIDLVSRQLLYTDRVTGSGTASWTFILHPLGHPIVSAVTYEFSDAAAVPEPATMLLLGSGLAGLAAARRKARTARR